MNLIWVLEPQSVSNCSLSYQLSEHFFVKRFSTLEQLEEKLKNTLPKALDLVIVNCDLFSYETLRYGQCFASLTCPLLLVGCVKGPHIHNFLKVFDLDLRLWDGNFEKEGFVSLIEEIVDLLPSFTSPKDQINTQTFDNIFYFDPIRFHFETLQLYTSEDDQSTFLTLKEGQILKLLMSTPQECVSRKTIASYLWPQVKVSDRVIDSHVSRLRGRLKETSCQISSVYGMGYKLEIQF